MSDLLKAPMKHRERGLGAWSNLLLLSPPLAVLATMGYRRRWVSEDAFISLRVVRNLIDGHGPVFNVDERVEVYTHPLWVGLLALWELPGLPLEQGAAFLGLFLAVAGLAAAMAGCVTLLDPAVMTGRADRSAGRMVYLPLGALIFVAVPVVWDFATSGLETGLIFFWSGCSFWLLARVCCRRPSGWALYPVALFLGLGPLIRPDLAIHSGAFLIALLGADRSGPAVARQASSKVYARALSIFGSAAAIPLVYQLFRMGYFAALVPNTALAKEAGGAHWAQGWRYLQDFTNPYWLWLPAALLSVWWVVRSVDARRERNRVRWLLVAAPVAAGSIQALYVVRLGGDFMHGRMLLPALFAVLLPSMVVQLPRPGLGLRAEAAAWTAAGVIILWALTCALWLRWPDGVEISRWGIADERAVYVDLTGHPNPVQLDDFQRMRLRWAAQGERLRSLAATRPRMLFRRGRAVAALDPALDPEVALVDVALNIGVRGFAAGPSVHLVDSLGIGDPLASRMRIKKRGRPGHEKRLPLLWARARFEDPAQLSTADPAIATAATVLACGEVAELLAAIEEPLTVQRFLANLTGSLRFTRLRIDPSPSVAVEEECPATAA
jgi:arabinofuranosyltransferase